MDIKLPLSDYLVRGNIVHFDKFDFFDGRDKKGRLAIIIQEEMDGKVVLATMSASFKIPADLIAPKCIKHDTKPIRCYNFPQKIVVGVAGFSFDLNSYVNLHANPMIFERTIEHIKINYYDKKNIGFKDKLIPQEYTDLLYCAYHSSHIKRGLKKYLNEELERLHK